MSDQSILFAKDPVWVQTTRSGFRQQVFVMYHSPRAVEMVESIVENGFKPSDPNNKQVLGCGVYVSRDIAKASIYGRITFKMLVYPGKTKTIIDKDDPLRTSWQTEFSSAWIPPNNVVAPGGMEETCVKSSAQVRILGIARGWEYLPLNMRHKLKNVTGSGDKLDKREDVVLEHMLEKLGIAYSSLVNISKQRFLEARRGRIYLAEYSGADRQLWSRTWDNCLENKDTGETLTSVGDDAVTLQEVNMQLDRRQKWRIDGKGRFVHKATSRVLISGEPLDPAGLVLGVKTARLQAVGQCDFWKFRCLYEIRERDDFLQFTPWQDMISWD